MITAEEAKMHCEKANSTEELKIRFKQWLQDAGVRTEVINVANAGYYSYTFGMPHRFALIAEDYLKELGYKVTMFPENIDDSDEPFTRYVTIDWRD